VFFPVTALHFEFKGNEYRRNVLEGLGNLRAVMLPEMEQIRDSMVLSPASVIRHNETKEEWMQRRRYERIDATTNEGATPTGRQK
ncbi:hypothetical protein PENTCL1PPCAC_12102, partial [Pristionchus entomophagus]